MRSEKQRQLFPTKTLPAVMWIPDFCPFHDLTLYLLSLSYPLKLPCSFLSAYISQSQTLLIKPDHSDGYIKHNSTSMDISSAFALDKALCPFLHLGDFS